MTWNWVNDARVGNGIGPDGHSDMISWPTHVVRERDQDEHLFEVTQTNRAEGETPFLSLSLPLLLSFSSLSLSYPFPSLSQSQKTIGCCFFSFVLGNVLNLHEGVKRLKLCSKIVYIVLASESQMTPQSVCVWAWPGLHVANSILVIKFFAAHKFGFNALSAPLATDSGKFTGRS